MLGFGVALDAFDDCFEDLCGNPRDCYEASATFERVERERVMYQ
jgi:hypothetical protein